MSHPDLRERQEKPCLLAIVVPCFNEEDVLPLSIPKLLGQLEEMIGSGRCSEESYVVFVDDGSRDTTWALIDQSVKAHQGKIRGVRLARNVGHQAALLAGLNYVDGRCDAAISIDADLQDDITAMARMVDEFRQGAELVLGVRDSRDVDTWFKRNTALGFYRLLRLMGVELVENHADFRLMSSMALQNLGQFSEHHLFLRGLVPMLHQRIATVTYDRSERAAGETKYPTRKMLSLAWNGITSLSVQPLRFISALGFLVFLATLCMLTYAIASVLSGSVIPGWASVVIPLYLLGGLLMISIGMVGEYIAKLFLEVKNRPRFFIDTVIGDPRRND